MKKFLSILLTVATLIGIVAMSGISAAAKNYESESNNSYAEANTLKLNSSIYGNLKDSSDVDVYKITTSKNGKLTFYFEHTYFESYFSWKAQIYQYKNGKYVELTTTEIWADSNEKVELPYVGSAGAGIYYIKISRSVNSSDREYRLSNTFAETSYACYEQEPNNSYAEATEISANRKYSGYLNNWNDVDIYKITTTKNGNLSFIFEHTYTEGYYYWNVSVYQYADGKYTKLSDKNISVDADEKIELYSFSAVPSGVYFVRISNNINQPKGEYSITAKSSVEPITDPGNNNSGNNNNNNNSNNNNSNNDNSNNNNNSDNNNSKIDFSFMDVFNAILDFFKWLLSQLLSIFS